MTTYLVTGANGFIGQYVTRALLRASVPVRVLVRRRDSLPVDIAERVIVHQGDIRDPGAVRGAVDGVDSVIHLAGCARAWSPDPAEFHQVNAEAVHHLVRACELFGIERLVHVSTVLTRPRLERQRPATAYERSKLAGERLVLVSGRGIIVHPTRVYGAGPMNDANGVTRVIAAYLRGTFRVRLQDRDVQANYVHVEDVAEGVLLAAFHGALGEHYVLGGENSSLRGLLDTVRRVSGVDHRVIRIPERLALAGAAAAELWGMLGGKVPITRDWVRLFMEDHRTFGPAPRGYAPRSLEAGIAQTISWLRQQKRWAA